VNTEYKNIRIFLAIRPPGSYPLLAETVPKMNVEIQRWRNCTHSGFFHHC